MPGKGLIVGRAGLSALPAGEAFASDPAEMSFIASLAAPDMVSGDEARKG